MSRRQKILQQKPLFEPEGFYRIHQGEIYRMVDNHKKDDEKGQSRGQSEYPWYEYRA